MNPNDALYTVCQAITKRTKSLDPELIDATIAMLYHVKKEYPGDLIKELIRNLRNVAHDRGFKIKL